MSLLPPDELLKAASEILSQIAPTALVDSKIAHGEVTLIIAKEWVKPILKALYESPELNFNFLSDITAIDWLETGRTPRFDVVYNIYSLTHYHRLRLRAAVEETKPTIDSVCELWGTANYLEREVYDMFGIIFYGHPDLCRILMPDDWEGHPLRKDFPLGGSTSFYYKQDTGEYSGEPSDQVPRIRAQKADVL